jgi:transposase
MLAHERREFFELARLAKAPISKKVVRRIDEQFAIERDIKGESSAERRRSSGILEAFLHRSGRLR